MPHSVKNGAWTLLFLLSTTPTASPASRFDPRRDTDVVAFAAAALPHMTGARIADLVALSCSPTAPRCDPVVLQIDERDADYRWALDQGPAPVSDTPPGILDDNDVLFFRARDAGSDRPAPAVLRPHRRSARLEIEDPLDGRTGLLHLIETSALAIEPAEPHVTYDPHRDRMRGRRVEFGFTSGVPQTLVLHDGTTTGPDLLDRIKVRASASLLWGWLRFSRDESDLSTEVTGWRTGPLRATRHQYQRVRLGWGIRSPRFSTYTFFYPDFAELPVSLRLAHRPAALFGDIRIDVLLDFIDLRGWSLLLPGRPPLPIGDGILPRLDGESGDWFALRGPTATLLQVFDVSPSLASTRRSVLYREGATPHPPEDVPGEHPAIGYRIENWQDVDAGSHHLRARAYALDPAIDVESFVAGLRHPLMVRVVDEGCFDCEALTGDGERESR